MKARVKKNKVNSESTATQNAAIYFRVSSKEQQDGFSLDAQLKLLKDYAAKNNIEIVATYMDIETAKNPGRKNFGELIKFLKHQQKLPSGLPRCQTVLVEKTDRFYRNVEDLVMIKSLGVTVHLVKEGTKLSSDSGAHEKFVHGLNVLLAERFVNNLSEETRKGMLEKAQQGLWPSFAPIGYVNAEGDNRKRVIVPDPDIAPKIKRLFEIYARGQHSLTDLSKEAEELGLVMRKSGNELKVSALHDMLKNPIYYGYFDWKGVLYAGVHEAIITKELYDKVQEVTRKRSSCPTGQQKHEFLFGRMLTCAKCGCAIVADVKKGKYVYYRCTGNNKHVVPNCPEKQLGYAREDDLDQQIVASLAALSVPDDVAEWIATIMNESNAEADKQRKTRLTEAEQQIQKLEDQSDAMYQDKLNGVISGEDYKRRNNRLVQQVANLKEQMAQLAAQNGGDSITHIRVLELAQKAASLYSGRNQQEKRELLNLLHSNSTLGNKKININYRKPFDIIAEINKLKKSKTASSRKKKGSFDDWRPRDDSNVRPLP
jgi:DNA invertase Pin-like site-specific DNA recombinase